MFHNVKNLLKQFTRPDEKWKLTLLQEWHTIIGPLHVKVSIVKIDHDSITLGVIDSCWMQELQAFSSLLLNSINETLDQPRIKRIRFKKAKVAQRSPRELTPAQTTVNKTVVMTPSEEQALTRVQNTELQEVLHTFRARCVRMNSTWKN